MFGYDIEIITLKSDVLTVDVTEENDSFKAVDYVSSAVFVW